MQIFVSLKTRSTEFFQYNSRARTKSTASNVQRSNDLATKDTSHNH